MSRCNGRNGRHIRSGAMTLPPDSKLGREQEARHRVRQESRIGATLKMLRSGGGRIRGSSSCTRTSEGPHQARANLR